MTCPHASPKGHMYSRGWAKVVGDIMGVQRGRLSVPHAWTLCEHNSNPFSKRRRRTDGPSRPTPPWQSPCRRICPLSLAYATKQQLHDARRRQEFAKNTRRICDHAQPFKHPPSTDSFLFVCQNRFPTSRVTFDDRYSTIVFQVQSLLNIRSWIENDN